MRKLKKIVFRMMILCVFLVYIALASLSHTINPKEILRSPWFQDSVTKVIMKYSGTILEKKLSDYSATGESGENDDENTTGDLMQNVQEIIEELPIDLGSLAGDLGSNNK